MITMAWHDGKVKIMEPVKRTAAYKREEQVSQGPWMGHFGGSETALCYTVMLMASHKICPVLQRGIARGN